jgi:putative RecB family exonuclease
MTVEAQDVAASDVEASGIATGDAAQPVAGDPPQPRLPSLSPSRAADFKTCPLLFRFRTIDRLPEQPSPDQARGTLVHAVLERLFDLPAEERTPERAATLVSPAWERLLAEQEELAGLFETAAPTGPADAPDPHAPDPDAPGPDTAAAEAPSDGAGAVPGQAALIPAADVPGRAAPAAPATAEFLASATDLLAGYFAVEDPRRLEPAQREALIESTVDGRLVIRGYVDRLDISPAGDMRVVDYKTGGAPREAFEARALFQLKFYALVLWRIHGVVPRVLRLLYLRDAEACDYSPDPDELLRFERNLLALWQAIERATETGDFRPKPSRLCGWCSHQAHCPAFGGTPPAYPGVAATRAAAPAPTGVDTPGAD